jgi:hypothetical protein
MSQFKGPFPLARQSLRYVEYYYRSIEEWQKRLAHSSLPQKMGRALVHTLNVLTADAIANDQEGWALPTELPYSPEERTRLRLYTSIANAVLFPRFEEAEWDLFATLIPDDSPPRHPDLAELLALTPVKDREVSIVLACQIITLYRNYRLSGGQVRVRRRFPALARHFLATTLHEGATAWETGIWIVAVRACGELSNKETQTDPADFRTLFDHALRQFEDQFWDPVAECYRQRAVATPGATPETYSGQLAAQFFADFFKWDHMLQEERVAKSLTFYSGDPTPHIREERCPTDLGAAGHVIADIERTALQFAHGMEEAGTHNMALLVQRAIDRHTPPAPQWLALWHLLFTVEGVFLDVAAGRLHIAPQLPAEMMSVSAPVFTAVCLGSLKYSLVREPSYRLQVQVELDSPVMLNDVKLFAPGPPPDARVRCTVNDDPAPCEIEVVPQSTGAHYRVRFRQPIFLNGAIYISIG